MGVDRSAAQDRAETLREEGVSATTTTTERLIIVDINDGHANTKLVHLPAERSNKGGFRFDSYEFPPATWPAACGNGSGAVYVHTGPFEDALICRECRLAT